MPKDPLEPGCLYHIYNHAVGSDNLFKKADNYYYFLKRYQHFICSVADTYAYCLMPNHIHFLIEVKNDIELPVDSKYSIPKYISKTFSNLFSSYSQAFNKQQNRRGNLFISNFRRKQIETEDYVTRLISYIHYNPVHHGFVKDISSWKFSSFNILNSSQDTFLAREKVMKWYGNQNEFRRAHEAGGGFDNDFNFE